MQRGDPDVGCAGGVADEDGGVPGGELFCLEERKYLTGEVASAERRVRGAVVGAGQVDREHAVVLRQRGSEPRVGVGRLGRAGYQDDRRPAPAPFEVPRVPSAAFREEQVRRSRRGSVGRQVVAEARCRARHHERHDDYLGYLRDALRDPPESPGTGEVGRRHLGRCHESHFPDQT